MLLYSFAKLRSQIHHCWFVHIQNNQPHIWFMLLHAQDNSQKAHGNAGSNSRCLSQNLDLKDPLQFRMIRRGSVGDVFVLLLVSEMFLFKKRRGLRNLVAGILQKYKAWFTHAPFYTRCLWARTGAGSKQYCWKQPPTACWNRYRPKVKSHTELPLKWE